MQPITIKLRNSLWYRIFFKEDYVKRTISIPSTWNDLSLLQLRIYIRALYLRFNLIFEVVEGKITVKNPQQMFATRIHLLQSLLGFTYFTFRKAYPEEILRLLSDEKAGEFLLTNFKLTNNPVPDYKRHFWHKKLYGPANNLGDIDGEELMFAEKFYYEYKAGKQGSLDLMIAMLYRPRKGGKRTIFDKELTDEYLHQIATWPLDIKIAIFIFFESVRERWILRFDLVYKKPEDVNQKPTSNSTMLDVYLSMAGGKFGSFNETIKSNAFMLLSEMQRILKDQDQDQ